MPHSLILGMTESGKTTLARDLAAEYRAAGTAVLVLDPLRDPRWQADYITSDPVEYMRVVWASRSCMLFVDEAGEAVGKYDVAMQALATRARHWGHSTHFVTQRGAQLSPTVRHQCRYLFMFCSGVRDGQVMAEEFNQPLLESCNSLRQGEYFFTSRFGELQRKRVTLGDTSNASPDTDRNRNRGVGRGSRVERKGEKESGNAASNAANAASGDASTDAAPGDSESG